MTIAAVVACFLTGRGWMMAPPGAEPLAATVLQQVLTAVPALAVAQSDVNPAVASAPGVARQVVLPDAVTLIDLMRVAV